MATGPAAKARTPRKLRPRRQLTPDELDLWRSVVGAPEAPRAVAASAKKRIAAKARAANPAAVNEDDAAVWRQAMGESVAAAAPAPLVTQRAKPTAPQLPGDIDPHDAKAIHRGRIAVEGRVDLHGLTQADAHAALVRFLRRSAADGKRCVLVITGKGTKPADDESPYARLGAGVLRISLPRWLESPELAPFVISSGAASPRDGGGGARYVLLRRQKAPARG